MTKTEPTRPMASGHYESLIFPDRVGTLHRNQGPAGEASQGPGDSRFTQSPRNTAEIPPRRVQAQFRPKNGNESS